MTPGTADTRLDTRRGRVRDVLRDKRIRLQVLFLVALLGVLLVVGLVVAELAGRWVSLGYAVVALALLCHGAARARAAQQSARSAGGRACTCCTSTQSDPVKVI